MVVPKRDESPNPCSEKSQDRSELELQKLKLEVQKLERENSLSTRQATFWLAATALGIAVSRETRDWIKEKNKEALANDSTDVDNIHDYRKRGLFMVLSILNQQPRHWFRLSEFRNVVQDAAQLNAATVRSIIIRLISLDLVEKRIQRPRGTFIRITTSGTAALETLKRN